MAITESVQRRLRSRAFTKAAALDAIRGSAVPEALGREVMRLCLVRGIRYHEAFAKSAEVEELRCVPIFARAINARAIMSNTVPEAMTEEETPYCIWYPETATQETYRKLAERYPHMAYHAARACAVAGYTSLYHELEAEYKLLPEVAIAEEARACDSKDIFESIINHPAKFMVMDDYSRSILAKPRPSGLNGDTGVRPFLEVKQNFTVPVGSEAHPYFDDDESDDDEDDDDFMSMVLPRPGFKSETFTTRFNITEDRMIDEFDSPDASGEEWILAMAQFLTKPLPADLPMGNKDILILAAADAGNIDRYTRLQRPKMVEGELACIVRGIYHNHFFATWWANQPEMNEYNYAYIMKAVHARMIMSNDLSRVTAALPDNYEPYLIWYPDVASENTYLELSRRLPSMKVAVAQAAIFAGYRRVFDAVLPDIEPTPALLLEAKRRDLDDKPCYYTQAILARASELGLGEAIEDVTDKRWKAKQVFTLYDHRPGSRIEHPSSLVFRIPSMIDHGQIQGMYNGIMPQASDAHLWASVPQSWLPTAGESARELDYNEWPPKDTAGALE